MSSKIRVQNALSKPLQCQRGPRQGDGLSCLLFNLALEKIIRNSNINTAGTIFHKSVQILAFADDIAIIGRTKRNIESALINLAESAQKMGLRINKEKTKYMKSTVSNPTLENLKLDKENIEYVEDFAYLGSLLNNDNQMGDEIKRRILLANRTYYALRKNFASKLPRYIKLSVYRTLIRPVLTNGSETWTLTQSNQELLRRFERKIFGKIYGAINVNGLWRRRYNYELYQLYKEPDIVKHIKIMRLRWIGHVARTPEATTLRKIFDRRGPVGRRGVGRPRIRYMGDVKNDMRILGIRR